MPKPSEEPLAEPLPQPDEPKPVVPEPPKKKTADRPHWITIGIGLLSPSLAVVGLGISLVSLRTSRESTQLSQESMEIGQRAYVHADLLPTVRDEPTRWAYSLLFKNQGNTPAHVFGVVVVAADKDKCQGEPYEIYDRTSSRLIWQAEHVNSKAGHQHRTSDVWASAFKPPEQPCSSKSPNGLRLSTDTSVGGKDTTSWPILEFTIPNPVQKANAIFELPSIRTTFHYEDVFHHQHSGTLACSIHYESRKVTPKCYITGD